MAGVLDTLDTARSGLRVTQRGLATTGQNIANVDTPGYSRQRSVVQAAQPLPFGDGTLGTGVEHITVQRVIDEFVNARLNSETSRQAQLETESAIYRDVESIVNEQLAGGLTSDLTGFFDALSDLSNAATPGAPVERGQLVAAAETLIDTVHRADARLRDLQRNADRAITAVIPQINALSARIADMNEQIFKAEIIAPANDLRDQRDELIRQLSEKVEIALVDDSDGMVSIRITGGLPLVDRGIASELQAVVDPTAPNPFDPTFSQVYYNGAGNFFDATTLVRGGELGGLIEARDGVVGGAIRDLDALVFTLQEQFNTVHRGGLGLVDGTANDFFLDLAATQTTVDDSARNFGLAAAIDPSQGGTLDNIAAAALPAAGGGGEGAVGDLDHAEVLGNLRNASLPSYLAGDAVGTPTGASSSVANGLINLVGTLGQKAQSTNLALAQQEAVLSSVKDRRDQISGVSIDEEVAQLVKLQANFQANARVISVVSGLFQSLLDAL